MTASHPNDARFMAAAIRLARQNLGRTGTNPSVGALLVKDDMIVGRGVTASGGRPHAETQAISEAGPLAHGATAYVTLEPCAHHGQTPPCANALVAAGISRVVIAMSDPDPRVAGKGAQILRDAGIEVVENVLTQQAYEGLSNFLTRIVKKRPEVTLKLAVSADHMIGKVGQGQVPISGEIARRFVHMMRAQNDAILIGSGTAAADDPELTCRLAGLENRSPIRIVLDSKLGLPLHSKLVASAKTVPVWLAALENADQSKRNLLSAAGCQLLPCKEHDGKIDITHLFESLSAQNISSILLEGGAGVASAALQEGLVDRITLISCDGVIGDGGISAPLHPAHIPSEFRMLKTMPLGADILTEYVKV